MFSFMSLVVGTILKSAGGPLWDSEDAAQGTREGTPCLARHGGEAGGRAGAGAQRRGQVPFCSRTGPSWPVGPGSQSPAVHQESLCLCHPRPHFQGRRADSVPPALSSLKKTGSPSLHEATGFPGA